MKIQIVVFWVITPSSDAEYQRFGEPCCLHLQGEVNNSTTSCIPCPCLCPRSIQFTLKMEIAWTSETLVPYPNTTRVIT